LGNPVVEDLGAHVPLALIEELGIEEGEIQLMQLLPRDLELRRFNKLRLTKQTALGMRDAPSAKSHVTMVFTFIEGARPLVRCHAEELANRIKQLCMKARKLLRKYNGYECQELQGDFMLAFFNPCDAILWCGEFQLQIAQMFEQQTTTPLMFNMSMGIETGIPASVSPHKTSGRADYFGNIVNQTARIAKAAHGGQIMIGGDAWNALMKIPYSMNECVPSEILNELEKKNLFRFKSHGYHSFKGISLPIGLIEAIPFEPQQIAIAAASSMGEFVLETFCPTTSHPKAKPATESQLKNLKKTTLSNVPLGFWRLHHHDHRTTQNTIRETEIHLGMASLSLKDEEIAAIESGESENDMEEDDFDEESDFEEEEDVQVVERAEDIRVSVEEDDDLTRPPPQQQEQQQQQQQQQEQRNSSSKPPRTSETRRHKKLTHVQQHIPPPAQQHSPQSAAPPAPPQSPQSAPQSPQSAGSLLDE
jgi:class 3 adenylate cyclase